MNSISALKLRSSIKETVRRVLAGEDFALTVYGLGTVFITRDQPIRKQMRKQTITIEESLLLDEKYLVEDKNYDPEDIYPTKGNFEKDETATELSFAMQYRVAN